MIGRLCIYLMGRWHEEWAAHLIRRSDRAMARAMEHQRAASNAFSRIRGGADGE